MQKVSIPVSFGELVDKITILEIKKEAIINNIEYINDELNELSLILNQFYPNDETLNFYKKCLMLFNKKIWKNQDIYRSINEIKIRDKYGFEIMALNDARFRIKKKIDSLTSSVFREQKSYPKKKAFFLGHLGMGDHLTCNAIVRYLACLYDEVRVVVKSKYFHSVTKLYADDKTITFHVVNTDSDISVEYGFSEKEFKKTTAGFDVFKLGFHNKNSNKKMPDLPFCFYDELKLEHSIFFDFFHIPRSNQLVVENLNEVKFILTQCYTSHGKLFDIKEVLNQNQIDPDEFLIIDINENFYKANHKFYQLAEKYRNRDIAEYINIVDLSCGLVLSDSALLCLIISKKLTNKFVLYKTRNHFNLEHLNNYRKRYFMDADIALFRNIN